MAKKHPASEPAPSDLLAEETILADAGEAAGVFLHELGNVLNNLLLSARLMQRQVPEEAQERLAESCRLITQVAGQMQQLAKFRQGRRVLPYPVDLNVVVRAVLKEVGGKSSRVELDLVDAPALVAVTAADLGRVVRFLLQNALAVTGEKKPVVLRTTSGPEQIRLVIEDGGPPLEDAQMRLLFEPFANLRPEQNHLELAVCKNLVRRMNGQLAADALTDGVRFTASWPQVREK